MDEGGSPEKAAREAADWLARLNSRVVDTSELEAFFAWRRVPQNAAAYNKLEAHWRASLKLKGDLDVEAALAEAMQPNQVQHRSLVGRRLVLAGGLVALAGGAVFFALPRETIFETAVGEQRLVQLDDGSRVRLDTASRIAVQMLRSSRRIRLETGRADFDVAKDPVRPFVVGTPHADVQAIGTRFQVRYADERTDVALLEGKVEVTSALGSSGRTEQSLAPGQALSAGPGGLGSIGRVDTATILAWTQGRLEFRDTPLRDAVAEVNRYAPRPLGLAAPHWADERVNGGFAVGDVDAFVEAVTALYPLRAERRPDGSTTLHE